MIKGVGACSTDRTFQQYPYSPETKEGKKLVSLSGMTQAKLLQNSFVFDDAMEENKLRSANILDIPKLPDAWAQDVHLIKRYGILLGVIASNPIWWNIWKEKIELTDSRIRFKSFGFEIDIHDVSKRINFHELTSLYGGKKNIPSGLYLNHVQEFISSLGKNYEKNLMEVLAFDDYFYWTNLDFTNKTENLAFSYMFGDKRNYPFNKDTELFARLFYKI